jgi:hypothetical protein
MTGVIVVFAVLIGNLSIDGFNEAGELFLCLLLSDVC